MTGYQEAVTDPSYAGQIITFTYPLIGNYGVSGAAMESDRVQARGVIMRDAHNGEDVATAEGGWLDWLADCGVPAISGVDTRALVSHIRDRGAMRGGIFAADLSESEAAAADRGRALDGRRRPGPHRDPAGAGQFDGDGHHVVGIDTGIKLSIIRQLRERGCRVTLLPCSAPAEEVLARGSRPGLPRQRPRRPGRARLRRRDRARAWSARSRCSGSASATSCSAGPSASTPSSCPSATAAPTTRSRTWRRAGSTSPPRTTASRCRARAASRRSRATSRSAGRPTSARPSSPTSTSTTARSRVWC